MRKSFEKVSTHDDARFDGKPRARIQYKGTDLCADIDCSCGEPGHVDGMFAYHIKCGHCGRLWALSMTVEMLPVTPNEIRDGCEPLVSSDCDNPDAPEVE